MRTDRLRTHAERVASRLELAERIALAYFVLRSPSATVYPDRARRLKLLRLVELADLDASGNRQYAVLPMGRLVDAVLRGDETAIVRALEALVEAEERSFAS